MPSPPRARPRALVALGVGFVALLALGGCGADTGTWSVGPSAATVDPARAAAEYDQVASQVDLHRHRKTVAVIGDSYTGGSAMGGSGWEKWTAHLVVDFQYTKTPLEIHLGAGGGSGYVSPGTMKRTFGEFVDATVTTDTDIVVIFGSRNDAGRAGVRQAADGALDDARRLAPRARLLVIGPPWVNDDVPAAVRQVRDDVRGAARARGAVFVDPIEERWFTGADSKLIGADGVHPTDAGHAYMAERIRPHLAAVIAESEG